MLLVISHIEDAHDPRYVALEDNRHYVISGGRGDVLLADSTVSSPHARLTITNGALVVEDLGSASGTFVEEQRIWEPTPIAMGQQVRVGETLLHVTPGERVPRSNVWEEREPSKTEDEFLDALRTNPADDATRTVYADWLESVGCRKNALYIRAELADRVDIETDEALGTAMTITRPAWRALIRRGRIGPCPIADCVRHWHLLEPMQDVFERRCTQCKQTVRYCSSTDEVIHHGVSRLWGVKPSIVAFDAGVNASAAADGYYNGPYIPGENRSSDYGALVRLFGKK